MIRQFKELNPRTLSNNSIVEVRAMKLKHGIYISLLFLLLAGCSSGPTPQPGWYPQIARFDDVSKVAVLPVPKGVSLIDSRPAKRKYDNGHIPTAISIPDRVFDTLTGNLPADKNAKLIFYCGGVKCMLSHKSAFKAEKLGYTNISVYAEGFPDWKENGGLIAIPVSHVKARLDSGKKVVVVDSRPKARKYDKGHIPGAISIPDSSFDKMIDRLPADKATPLYFYCGGLKCKLSSNSATKAINLGYTHVRVVPTGYPAWVKAYGKGDVFKAPTVKKGSDEGTIAVTSFKEIYASAPETLLIVDVRDPDEFKSGKLKGAINIPINELEKRMDELKPGKTIVFFCGTAGRAGEAYDIMKMFKPELKTYFLNADTTLHADGSFTMKEFP
jgi:rhodanese-related sulfurtransferase